MRYLVTGGAGFIGSNFVRMLLGGSLVSDDLEVVVLDNFSYAANLANLKMFSEDARLSVVKGDITDEDLVGEVLKKDDVVINFAAQSHVDRSLSNPSEFVRSNIVGVETLMRQGLKNGISKFVQISTDEVYGSKIENESHEDDSLLPNSPYSASKAAADLLVRSYVKSFGLNASITRCCNNFGPFQFPEKLIPLFITSLIMERKVPVYGSGLNIREWIHVDDHCRGIQKVIAAGQPGEIYNLGTNHRLSNIELTEMILHELGKDQSAIEYVDDRPGHDFRYALNTQKARDELGLVFTTDFNDLLKSTIEWYRVNPEWWRPLLSGPKFDQKPKALKNEK
jgi:dTDP-glucose 4,6-dehydratase